MLRGVHSPYPRGSSESRFFFRQQVLLALPRAVAGSQSLPYCLSLLYFDEEGWKERATRDPVRPMRRCSTINRSPVRRSGYCHTYACTRGWC